MTETLILTISLFFIGTLHTLIFGTFQYPSNFIVGGAKFKHLAIDCKIVLYASAIFSSFCYQTVARVIGVKLSLIAGLFLNLMGIVILWVNHAVGGSAFLLFFDMLCFGLALTSVINVLITFIILTYPTRAGAGITALFAFLNAGIMLAPLLIGIFEHLNMTIVVFPLLMLLTFVAIWYVQKYLREPHYPTHLRHLRKGSLIWKELHYRLGLFFLCIILYGILETNFSMWGFEAVLQTFGESIALETIPFFFLFLIMGQLFLLLPLYFYSPNKIFYGLCLITIAALYFLFQQEKLFGFVLGFIFGGLGCSALFPILISMMEKELFSVARGRLILPYIETGVSVLIAGYLLGNAINDLRIGFLKEAGETPFFHLGIGIASIALMGLVGLSLNLTAPKRMSSH